MMTEKQPERLEIPERPALPKLSVGDKVLVIDSNRRKFEPIDAVVAKVGQKLVTLGAADNKHREWVMRMDTQIENTDYPGDRFATLEQFAFDANVDQARRFLAERRINVGWDGPWRKPGYSILLADAVRELERRIGE